MKRSGFAKKIRQPKCKICRRQFIPISATAICCCIDHALQWVALQKEKRLRIEAKRQRAEDRERKIKLQPPSYWADRAQAAVNQYRRLVLRGEPCISCGRHHQGQYHAGHFVSRGASAALRFEHDNIWLQCKPCNSDKGGNVIEYRKALVLRIGVARVEWLEGPHEMPRWRENDYKAIEAEHVALFKKLQKDLDILTSV